MTRQRMFLDIDVVTAAKVRLRHVFSTFDEVWVQFSGGKDSTAVLYLAKEVSEELGYDKVNVIFRDEEMVSPAVIDFVTRVRDYPWVNMEWYCLPGGQECWVLGQREYVLLWSGNRLKQGRTVREMPPWAIRAEHFGLDPCKPVPETIDFYTMQGKKGRVAFINGVRANESMIRYRSCVQKLHENYIVTPFRMKKSVPLRFVKPIYDWTTDDVLKYLDDQDAEICEYYNLAAITKANTRVGIPLHAVAARRLSDVVDTEPEFFDQLQRVYIHIDAQRRWWGEFDIERLIYKYASQGWDGVARCIDDNMLTPGMRKQALRFAGQFRKKHSKDPFSYPIDWLIRTLLLNEFSTTSPNPVGPKTKAHAMRVAAAEAEKRGDTQ